MIPGPRNDPDSQLNCEDALGPFFRALADTEPAAFWTGAERDLLPLRRDAHEAGWSQTEIDRALICLAATFRNARIEMAKTDVEVLIAKMFDKHRGKRRK